MKIALFTGSCLLITTPIAPDHADAVPVSHSEIKPIFSTRCQQCHNWINYQEAYNKAIEIRYQLKLGTMPPNNITGLTHEERGKIIEWVNTGAKE